MSKMPSIQYTGGSGSSSVSTKARVQKQPQQKLCHIVIQQMTYY